MLPSIPWFKVLKYGLPAVILIGTVYWSVTSLIEVGEENVRQEWKEDVARREGEIRKLKEEIAANERQHRTETDAIEARIVSDNLAYERKLADSRIALAGELRRSEGRASLYRRMSEAGDTERANLASYAAQLDRSLVEGRQVVEELRATVVQRDEQLRALGQQLEADRKLIGVH